LGFPGEDDRTIRENIDFIENCGVEYYSLKEFFYMEHTSVHDKREEYGLTGMGARWSHKTMSYEQASHIKLDMFREIKNASHLDPDTSLWLLAYLYDQGHDFAQIRGMQDRINDVVQAQLRGDFTAETAVRGVKDYLPQWRARMPQSVSTIPSARPATLTPAAE
jgi:anaerobic magnesium-protoporphyrin IX monomethyl ester cyclase